VEVDAIERLKAESVSSIDKVAPVIVGDVRVLLVRVSDPARVASVPVVGKVTFVAPVVVNVNELVPEVTKAPAVVILPPRSIVLAVSLTSKVSVLSAVNEDDDAKIKSFEPLSNKDKVVAPLITGALRVARVPVVGKVTLVAPVVVKVRALAPDVVKSAAVVKAPVIETVDVVVMSPPVEILPLNVMVLAALLTSKVRVRFAVNVDVEAIARLKAESVSSIDKVAPVIVGVLIAGDVSVLLVKVSAPFNVASVPVVGKVTSVAPVVVKVREFAPEVIKSAAVVILPPILMVREAALTSKVRV
jgi:hypothetical protein